MLDNLCGILCLDITISTNSLPFWHQISTALLLHLLHHGGDTYRLRGIYYGNNCVADNCPGVTKRAKPIVDNGPGRPVLGRTVIGTTQPTRTTIPLAIAGTN